MPVNPYFRHHNFKDFLCSEKYLLITDNLIVVISKRNSKMNYLDGFFKFFKINIYSGMLLTASDSFFNLFFFFLSFCLCTFQLTALSRVGKTEMRISNYTRNLTTYFLNMDSKWQQYTQFLNMSELCSLKNAK